ncbi:Receptor protein kinase-like protein [Actinidia chinensis var. chinensis]|uniref:Receptor protein kinase-like protein n=1 Tax=Actinidia chinensis var. chinensis TaxID=1590841 RepID=A0A2R6S230_ACTCC|nr:Receptor protein kinase-like protein [Actinidia chinensis var. chinensis]
MNSIALGLVSFLTLSISLSSSLSSDGLSLLALKSAISADPTLALAAWSDSDPTPCRWAGIACDRDHRVTAISLSDKELTGYLPSELGAILSLQHLSLSNNNFSSLIPSHLFNSPNLLSLDLSRNSLSGPIPPQISYLQNLSHLDLSSNLLNGSLPDGLSNLTHFTGTLNLSYNRFSGEIPPSYGRFPVMVSLDLRHNNLTGKIPQVGSLLNQGPTAFSGNPSLCGFPLQTPCPDPEAQNPRILSNPENPINPNSQTGFVGREKGRNGSVAVPIISGVSAVIGVFFLSAWVYRKKWTSGEGKMGREKLEKEVDGEEEEGQKGKFVAVDEELGLELEDLLRASAYVVGKSRSGIVYKVVGRGSGVAGVVVAVRRLSECNTTWRLKEFEAEVESVSRVQHPNMVRLRAYYYASDEKLLVSDFISNGSLYTALHGGPAESSPPLSWSARLRIAQGIARGLAHIHECSPRKHVHGNLKSSKILLDDDMKPYISGFGLTRLVSGTSKSTNAALKTHNLNIVSPKTSSSSSIMYVAPEVRVSGNRVTQKSDVYSFGIVLLEILTGRFPGGGLEKDGKGLENLVRKVFREERPLSEIIDPALVHEVHTKKQVVATFHTALNCTELDPEVRPRMRTISENLDRIESQ